MDGWMDDGGMYGRAVLSLTHFISKWEDSPLKVLEYLPRGIGGQLQALKLFSKEVMEVDRRAESGWGVSSIGGRGIYKIFGATN